MKYGYTMLLAALVLLLLGVLDALLARRMKEIPQKANWRMDVVLFLSAWIVLFALNNHSFVVYNNYSYLSESFLAGRLDSPDLPGYLESFELGGKIYMHFAPGVSILLTPLVAIFGLHSVNYAYVGITLGAGSTVLFFRSLENIAVGRNVRERFWCAVLVLFGTVHCFCAAVAHSWFIGHVASWFLLFASLYLETLPTRTRVGEGLAMFFGGLLFGLCVCCRLSNLLGAGVFVYFVFRYHRATWLRSGLLFALGAAVFGGLYIGMNLVRFGTVMDESYNLTHLKDLFKPLYYFMQEYFTDSRDQMDFLHAVQKMDWDAAFPQLMDRAAFLKFLQNNAEEGWNYCRYALPHTAISELSDWQINSTFDSVVNTHFSSVGGALQWKNASYNLYSIFGMLPEFSSEAPYVIPTLAGVSVSFCTPLIYAGLLPLWTKRRDPVVWVLLGSAIICAVPFVLNYGNGFAQFGMRYAMDFLPYALLLTCMGLTTGRWHSWKTALVLLCVLLNVWGPIYWNCFYLS
ncbi:MAG: hypothetical protein IJP98_00965 [Clostridia bacterium]|nr:hypothetical protein [Clostridia bacterium]